MPDEPIRILHLSDVHFRIGKAWDAEPVTRALARFIKAEVASGLLPDLVVFSGDLAFSGAAAEYAVARDWLENQLWPALPEGLPRDRLLLVPGNHDVDRGKVGIGVRAMQSGLLSAQTQQEIAALLSDEHDRDNMLGRHAAYMDFVAG
jgi:predicted MPP superfamily phosphohydrolase